MRLRREKKGKAKKEVQDGWGREEWEKPDRQRMTRRRSLRQKPCDFQPGDREKATIEMKKEKKGRL